jgi:hypothetical protein
VDSSQVDPASTANGRRNDEFHNVFAQESTLLIRIESLPSLSNRDLVPQGVLVERDLRLNLVYAPKECSTSRLVFADREITSNEVANAKVIERDPCVFQSLSCVS